MEKLGDENVASPFRSTGLDMDCGATSHSLAVLPAAYDVQSTRIIAADEDRREIFETLELGEGPATIVGAGMFTQCDFIIHFVRNRLLVNVAGAEADRVGIVVYPR